ncbi:hypothetical protein BVG16_18760 [Paenibacillus selenitireducens]|uniref:DinB-like domain-containing protein n=1 Tax=Paenibacillus selenitireducens TaxID=1324314 RepID=A0A1T2X8U8_9BACL|nr:DinB family protein [Paenibacillus selenitireducens]OPA76245.1 hypothetical protein BVG16_18760 [Paenibacillus selenitireducens]
MNAKELILLDLKETRRRFLKAVDGIPDEYLPWKPDAGALSIGHMIRHVLLHDYSWFMILTEQRLPTEEEKNPLWEVPYTSVQDEITHSSIYHEQFISYVESLDIADFASKLIQWPHRPIERYLGDALERKSYHDAVHTGQLLQYLRMLQLDRPDIWD